MLPALFLSELHKTKMCVRNTHTLLPARKQKGGGGGAAAAFAHDDRTGMGGSLDDSYGMGGGAGAGTSSRMGSRLQRDSGAGITGRWQHDMYDPRDSAPAPRRAGRLAGAAPSQPTRV